jgi:cytochrome c oxidase subunit 2
MFNIPLFPDEASSMARQVDYLYFFQLANLLFFLVLVVALVVLFAVKYRREKHPKAVQIHGSMLLEVAWTAIPFGIAMVMFVWSTMVYFDFYRPPANAMEIYGTGKQWMWKFQHVEGVREIDQLHVPVNRDVRVILTSQDVIHDFAVPAFRLKGDVIPGRYTSVWFRATKTGTYRLFCDQYCGTLHAGMIGEVIVMNPSEYQTWLGGGGGGSLAQQGEKLFTQLGCVTCHQANNQGRGPALAGVFGSQVKMADGRTLLADEAYIRTCIVAPAGQRVAGYQPLMPSFQGQISEEGIIQILNYIKSLKKEPAGGATNTAVNAPAAAGATTPGKAQ